MLETNDNFRPQEALLEWYDRHRRTLPWRANPHPYAVFVSELMLQQTQVDRVIPYFERFVVSFPSFEALAAAPRAEVIRLWSGLGYNRRAVHLHEAARIVVECHGGQLPSDRAALEALPGIGPYTAGALLSIVFGQPEAAPDTNVRRVIGRYAVGGAAPPGKVDEAVRRLVPSARAGDWNQALMDLGSAVCLGIKARCLICPLRPGCRSAGHVFRRASHPIDLYASSSRFYRGRLLAALAQLPVGNIESLERVSKNLVARGVAEPQAGWRAVGEALVRDGLARIEPLADGIGIGLA